MRIFRGLALVLFVAGLTVGEVAVLEPTPSQAQQPYYLFTGCKFQPSSINPIEYKYHSVSSAYQTAFTAGKNAWNAVGAPGYFSYTPWHSDPQIDVYDGYYTAASWVGLMTHSSCSNGIYPGNEVRIYFNQAYTLSSLQRKNTVIHELGHAYGLDHVYGVCSVMLPYLTTCSNFPTSHEVAGVNALY